MVQRLHSTEAEFNAKGAARFSWTHLGNALGSYRRHMFPPHLPPHDVPTIIRLGYSMPSASNKRVLEYKCPRCIARKPHPCHGSKGGGGKRQHLMLNMLHVSYSWFLIFNMLAITADLWSPSLLGLFCLSLSSFETSRLRASRKRAYNSAVSAHIPIPSYRNGANYIHLSYKYWRDCPSQAAYVQGSSTDSDSFGLSEWVPSIPTWCY